MQIFRVLNRYASIIRHCGHTCLVIIFSTLSRKKETRKRNLHFHLPAAVSCAPNLRLLQNDSSYITLGDIYDKHCEDSGMAREEPVMMSGEKVKVAMREFKQKNGRLVSVYQSLCYFCTNIRQAQQGRVLHVEEGASRRRRG